MQKETLQVALASLVSNPGPVNGWESSIVGQLGDVQKRFSDTITVAARLSAGITTPAENAGRLDSIFNSITLDPQRSPTAEQRTYAPVALSLNKDVIFPKKLQGGNNQKQNIDEIVKDIKQSLPKKYREDESYLEEVLSVLHRTTVNVPSSFSSDVSHFDQQRMTAALAVCLLEKKQEEIKEYLTPQYETEPIALLVGGDISGIQDFIYTITAKGAAKSLRGRSFYMQLLTEAILRFVLRGLDIPYTNVIYSGGGHFFLLAPLSMAKKLEDMQKEITQALLRHHGTSLYLALGCTEVPVGGFINGQFPVYWGKMHGALAYRKQKRYSELDTNTYKRVFTPREFGGNPDETCSSCKEDHRKTRKWDDLDIQDRICTLCDSFIEEIGKKLPRNNFIALGFGAAQSVPVKNASDALAEFGLNFQFLNSGQDKTNINAEKIVLWALDDPKKGEWPVIEDSPKWIRYTANHVPHGNIGGNFEIYSFDELQEKVEGGFGRLGVLRMDVDNLGDIFKRGLGDRATLSRLASLSFRMSLFFEGWLKKLCEDEKYKGLIYTVYAGGDDVFLIGPWDLIPVLAQEIVHDFSEYSGHNPDVHLSAGMAFIDGKYPVYQAAEDAADAIDIAKNIDDEKNAFTFLGRSWKWTVFNQIAGRQALLSKLVKPQEEGKKPAPQALLQVIQQLAREEQEHKKVKGLHVWGRWIWMGMYQLTRMRERHKDSSSEIKFISDELNQNKYQDIHQWGVAARWAELLNRKSTHD